MDRLYGTDSMPETAENVAEQFSINREDQDNFALCSQQKATMAQKSGRLAKEICPVSVPQRRGEPLEFQDDEHPRETNLEKLGQLRAPFRIGGSVTPGNASGINDGSAAQVLASMRALGVQDGDPRINPNGGAIALGHPLGMSGARQLLQIQNPLRDVFVSAVVVRIVIAACLAPPSLHYTSLQRIRQSIRCA